MTRDLKWYWLGLQIPLLVLAMHFAPTITAAVYAPIAGPETAYLERNVMPVLCGWKIANPKRCKQHGQ